MPPVLEIPVRTKVITGTRAMNGASGDISYIGVGFKPKAIIAFAQFNTGLSESKGAVGDDKVEGCIFLLPSANQQGIHDSAKLIRVYQTWSTQFQKADLKSFDDDGFTLTWELGGTTGGTIGLIFLCIG